MSLAWGDWNPLPPPSKEGNRPHTCFSEWCCSFMFSSGRHAQYGVTFLYLTHPGKAHMTGTSTNLEPSR